MRPDDSAFDIAWYSTNSRVELILIYHVGCRKLHPTYLLIVQVPLTKEQQKDNKNLVNVINTMANQPGY
ncbi:hypothetical protein, partial [Psychrobacter pygoscelis]|uniref:hypothetical protein n=1 Tax=Psychrobacter pygoscelis TaxID=2488563 RepID=UPI001A954E2B